MPELDQDAQKEVIKAALKEWLDDKYAEFGRRVFHGVLAAAFAGLVYLAIHRPEILK